MPSFWTFEINNGQSFVNANEQTVIVYPDGSERHPDKVKDGDTICHLVGEIGRVTKVSKESI